MVPKEYHEFLNVFSEEKAARFPESKPWDHKIDMKEGFEPKAFKNYCYISVTHVNSISISVYHVTICQQTLFRGA